MTGRLYAQGKRDALMILGTLPSDAPGAEELGKSLLPAGISDEAAMLLFGTFSLLVGVLAEHGEDLAAWVARMQDEDALAQDASGT